jgi:pimeloyl-ACP methyl ester carboxylesterase
MSNTGDPTVRGPSFETLMRFLQPMPTSRDAFVERTVQLFRHLGGPRHPADSDRVRRIAARSFDRGIDPAGVRRQLVAIWTSGNRKPALTRLTIPTLVIHGDADPLVPVDGGRDTAQAIPGARLIVVPGLGHDLPPTVWPLILDAVAAHAKAVPNR